MTLFAAPTNPILLAFTRARASCGAIERRFTTSRSRRLIQEPIDPSRGSWVLPFFYPPFFAGMLVPLAWLPFSLAFITMSAVNLGCLTAVIALLRSKLQLSQPQMTWLVLSTFCNFGVHYAFLEAQTSFLVLLLVTEFVLSAQANKSSGSGLWASLLCFKPQLIVGPLLVLLAWRRWREIGSIGIIVTTMGILSFLAVGKDGIQAYVALTRLAAAGDAVLHIQPGRAEPAGFGDIFFYFFMGRRYLLGCHASSYSTHRSS